MDVISLIRIAKYRAASDLHIMAGIPAMLRINGRLVPFEESGLLTPEDMQIAFNQLTSEAEKSEFNRTLELDFGYSVEGLVRVRCNAALHRGYYQSGDAPYI